MDPQVTWNNLLNAYQAADWPRVEEAAETLLAWLAQGGFPPRLDQEDEHRSRWIVRAVCSQALMSVPQSFE
jgi:hypothetical protein